MKVLIEKFYSEPVFALALVQAVCVYVIATVENEWVQLGAGLVAAVCTVAQRQLVTPEYE